MISVLLQLLGGLFLSWNALAKTKGMRIKEIRMLVPASLDVSRKEAFLKQKDFYLNIFGFSILSSGYLLQILEIDFNFVGNFNSWIVFVTFLFTFCLLYLIIYGLAKLTTNRLIEESKKLEYIAGAMYSID